MRFEKNLKRRKKRKRILIILISLFCLFLIVISLLLIKESFNQHEKERNNQISQNNKKSTRKKGRSNINNKKKHSNVNNKKTENIEITESKLQTIKLGNGGTTQKEVEKLFGKPDSTSTKTIFNLDANQLIWRNVVGTSAGGTMIIGFSNGHAIDKGISRLIINRNKRLQNSDFDSIKNGMTKKEVINLIGKPNGYTESLINDTKTEMLSYSSESNGYSDPDFQVVLKDGKVSNIKKID